MYEKKKFDFGLKFKNLKRKKKKTAKKFSTSEIGTFAIGKSIHTV